MFADDTIDKWTEDDLRTFILKQFLKITDLNISNINTSDINVAGSFNLSASAIASLKAALGI